MLIGVRLDAWNGKRWVEIMAWRTEDVVIALEHVRRGIDIATHPGQEWKTRVVVTFAEDGGN